MTRKQLTGIAIITAITAIILWVDSSTFNQPNKLKGGFTETGLYRNGNNTGPIIRIYAVKVEEPNEAAYEDYGNAMPHTLHGTTKVFFFDAQEPSPTKLWFRAPHFDTSSYHPIKVYEKNGVAKVSLKDY